MRLVHFTPTFDGWRGAARALLAEEAPPERLLWVERGAAQGELTGLVPGGEDGAESGDAGGAAAAPAARRVPRQFLEVAPRAACFRSVDRWPLLYRLLWRLTHGEPRLMDVLVDPDVHRLRVMEKAVRRDVHKMHAFVRFRRVGAAPDETYVAWFRPTHLVVEEATPFFARRFGTMRWSILGPDRSAYWDRHTLHFGPGVPRAAAPPPDALEELWRTYYAHVFNPARMRLAAMRGEMPRKYWADLPEAALIPTLVHEAPGRVAEMVERARRELGRPSGRVPRRRGGSGDGRA